MDHPPTGPFSFTPLFLRLLAKRDLKNPLEIDLFLNAGRGHLGDPFRMKGMSEAVERIRSAVQKHEKILIHGDYDIDGITGTALMARTLAVLGADCLTFLPERSRDGYGVSRAALQRANENKVSLFITVDCGISAHEEVKIARSFGCDVLVIDHHRIAAEGVPPANIILNPLQSDCPYAFKDLSAAGLVLKLSQALLGEEAFRFLDLAAFSTVGDVAPLTGENRILVKEGLKVLSERKNLGIRALAEVSGIKTRELNVGHIGFILGPRINAAGRMSSPEIALRLLLTDSQKEAASLARILNEENKARQKEEQQVLKDALAEVERTVNFNRERVIVIGKENWHAGVIGIVASRLVERYHRPAVVVALENGKGKGSGRSVRGFHLFHALEACKDSLEEFGGHELAAGLTVEEKKLPVFRKQINQYAMENIPADVFLKKIPVDLELKLEDLNAAFIRELKLLEPHGVGNPRPVFLTRNLEIKLKPQQIGQEQFKFCVTDGASICEVKWNNSQGAGRAWLEKGAKLDLIYSVKINSWNGMESLVLDAKEIMGLGDTAPN